MEAPKLADGFVPYHLTASAEDLKGNQGLGRYVFLCGPDERAKRIASHFTNVTVRENPRNHHLYLGTLQHGPHEIAVAAISAGIGCPSVDVVLNELILLGGRRFIRVGTAGSLQPDHIKTGAVVIATAAVRDEDTSACYISPDFPAIASIEMVNAASRAAEKLEMTDDVYAGIVHTKSSFYAREMGQSLLPANSEYMDNLRRAGVLATEMECSHIFILASLLGHREAIKFKLREGGILCGGLLAIVGDNTPISTEWRALTAIENAIALGLQTIKELASRELKLAAPVGAANTKEQP